MTFLEKIKSLFGLKPASKEKKEIDEKLNHYKEYGPTLSELYREHSLTPDECFLPKEVSFVDDKEWKAKPVIILDEIHHYKPSKLLKELIVLRNKGNLTQRQLANEIGISQALLSGLLRDNKAIFESTGSKLDEYFGQPNGTFYNAQLYYNSTKFNTSK